jgi:hypothetical protein
LIKPKYWRSSNPSLGLRRSSQSMSTKLRSPVEHPRPRTTIRRRRLRWTTQGSLRRVLGLSTIRFLRTQPSSSLLLVVFGSLVLPCPELFLLPPTLPDLRTQVQLLRSEVLRGLDLLRDMPEHLLCRSVTAPAPTMLKLEFYRRDSGLPPFRPFSRQRRSMIFVDRRT